MIGVSALLFPPVRAWHWPSRYVRHPPLHRGSHHLPYAGDFFHVLGDSGAINALPRRYRAPCSQRLVFWEERRGAHRSALFSSLRAVLLRRAHTIWRFYPPLWFLNLYQHDGRPCDLDITALFTGIALPAFGAALVWVTAAYALGYRRSFAGVLEGGKPPRKQPVARVALAFLDLFGGSRAAPRPGQLPLHLALRGRAGEAHRYAFRWQPGWGWLLGMQQAMAGDRGTRLGAPSTAAFCSILGLRIAFELPAGVASNWVFRATLNPGAANLPSVRTAARISVSGSRSACAGVRAGLAGHGLFCGGAPYDGGAGAIVFAGRDSADGVSKDPANLPAAALRRQLSSPDRDSDCGRAFVQLAGSFMHVVAA